MSSENETQRSGLSEHARLVAEAQEMERRAELAEADGRKSWAVRYRRRAEFLREQAGESEAAWFAKLEQSANDAEAQAAEYRARGDIINANLRLLDAQWQRGEACGFNFDQANNEYCRHRARAAVAFNQDALDALAVLCPNRKRRPAYLRRLLEEAIFAHESFHKAHSQVPEFLRLDAVHAQTRWCDRYSEHVNVNLAAEFVMAKTRLAAEQG